MGAGAARAQWVGRHRRARAGWAPDGNLSTRRRKNVHGERPGAGQGRRLTPVAPDALQLRGVNGGARR